MKIHELFEFNKNKILGKGTFGYVCASTHRFEKNNEHNKYAIKVCKKCNENINTYRRHLLEMHILMNLEVMKI